MEGCLSAENDVDKLIMRFDGFKNQYNASLDSLINEVTNLKQEFQSEPESFHSSEKTLKDVSEFCKTARTVLTNLSAQHKDLHINVSKIGKTIDRNFENKSSKVYVSEILIDDASHKALSTAICEHFYRHGLTDVAESLIKEASLSVDPSWKDSFIEINDILNSLQSKNVNLALSWALDRREKLQKEKSQLEFKLHRLKFLTIICKGTEYQNEAVAYLRNFRYFAVEYSIEVQKLMGCLLYIQQGLENSPYSDLLSDDLWEDACKTFAYDACKIMGLSVQSPLLSSFTAGCQALPTLLAIKSRIDQRQTSGVLTNADELPIDIDLDSSQHYHSVFACPILRIQTTEKNPPVRLVCGHVISKDALTKLVSGGKVKCPYCPVEQPHRDAQQVYF